MHYYFQKSGSLERDHSRDSDRRERDRDRGYSRSQDRHTSRDREHDWEHERQEYRDRDRDREWDRDRDKDRDRSYKHQDSYRRSYAREDREERKRPRTPPIQSTKRPHTPHTDHKTVSPSDIENISEEDLNHDRLKREKEMQETVPVEEAKDMHPSPKEETTQMDIEEFEPILSDEDILDDSEHYQEMDYDYTAYTNNDDLIKLFVPGVHELKKYRKAKNFEINPEKIEVMENLKTAIGIADDFFKSSITKYTVQNFERCNAEIKEEFIHLCEKVPNSIGSVENLCSIVDMHVILKDTNLTRFTAQDKEIAAQIQLITDTLLEWLKIALNFEMANAQDQPGYKIRHIKCGVRLAEWCSNSISFVQLLWDQNFVIHKILLNLYEKEYMALSIKLMILRALDTHLLKKPAVERFLLDTKDKANGFFENIPFSERNGYRTLVQLMCKNPLVRLKFALNSILKKLNFYEILYKLQNSLAKLRNASDKSVISAEIGLIVKALDQISHVLQSGPFVVSQPKRFLPVATQFEVNRSDCRNVLIDFLEMHGLLQSFALLLSHPNTMNIPLIKTPICEILSELLLSAEGLRYLSRNAETVNVLLKFLLQQEDEVQFLQDSIESKSHNLGLTVSYMLQCLYHVERLTDLGERCDCNASEVIDELHAMFCLTFSNVGKFACASVLGMDGNITCLLRFAEFKDKSEGQLQKLKKSPAMGYIADLIGFVVVCNANVSFLENYSKHLINIVGQKELFEAYVAEKLSEIDPYLKPLENKNTFNYDNISPLVELINRSMDMITTYPGQLITALRIIQYLGIPSHYNKTPILSENPLRSYIELKYKHVILQLFSLDGVTLMTKILQKICDHYEQPSLHTATFVSSQSISIINVIQPCIELLKQMLTYVIQCRNTHFKDLTSIPVLLQTYNLLRAFPINSPVFFKVKNICKDIVDTLLVYTQPVSEEIHEKDSLNKTLWTLMCGEVIKYIAAAPYMFVSGLLIFSELLPLPLPVQSRGELTKEEISWTINLRKLWSAHLHAHSNSIQDLVNRMCITSHQPLLNLLRRVCVQLSDLAANTAIMIARGILDTVHNSLNAGENKLPACNGNIVRLLNFLACLVTHSPLKCAILQLIHNNSASVLKSDEKYPALIGAFAEILKTSDPSNNYHVQSQECILSIFQSFCDSEITLLQVPLDDNTELTSETYLANALPIKEHFVNFITIMIDHLVADNTFVTYLPIVRTLLLLTEHNYGFYHLREILSRKSEPFLNVLHKLLEHFSKDSAECLSTLNALVEFLRVCAAPEDVDGTLLYTPRNMKMSLSEIKGLIGWRNEETVDNKNHPTYLLEDLLKVFL